MEFVDDRDKRAVEITEYGQAVNGEACAIVQGTPFHKVAIEVGLTGSPGAARVRLYWNRNVRKRR
jgi:hypothetical protein